MAGVLLNVTGVDENIVEVSGGVIVQDVVQYVVDIPLEGYGRTTEAEGVTNDLYRPNRVMKAVFHSYPSAIRTRLKAAMTSSLVYILA